jgi:membrane-associated phospholipid phosphatase
MAAKYIDRRLLLSVAICAALLTIVASILVLDRPTMDYIHDTAIALPSGLVVLLEIWGEPTPYIVVSSLVLLFCGIVYVNTGFSFSELRIPARAFFILLAAINPWLVAEMLEISSGRPRPRLYLAGGIYAFYPFKAGTDFASFPSEHAAVATAMATAFSILIPAYRSTFFLLAIIIAISRLIIGLNYPSDILAGMILGMVTVIWLKAIFNRFAIELRADKRRLR